MTTIIDASAAGSGFGQTKKPQDRVLRLAVVPWRSVSSERAALLVVKVPAKEEAERGAGPIHSACSYTKETAEVNGKPVGGAYN